MNDLSVQGNFKPAPLPKLDELYKDTEMAIATNDLNKILNAQPLPQWTYEHPMAKKKIRGPQGEEIEVPCTYLPISRVEWLLTRIFLEWHTIVKQVQLIGNSAVVTVRLEYRNPITGEWGYQEGVGAAPINTKKGASATDFAQILPSAVQTAVPSAKSYAIKDAAECIGKIFGKDLNRREDINYAPMQDAKFAGLARTLPPELLAVISEKTSPEELTDLYDDNPEFHHLPEFMRRIVARTEVLKKGGE